MVAPTREFAVSSLVIVGASTLAFGLALGYFVERGLLDREWASTTAFVQSAARTHLRPADFGAAPPATSLEAGDRFEEFARQVRMLPEVRRLVVYGPDARIQWTDVERDAPAAAGSADALRTAATTPALSKEDPPGPRVSTRPSV